MLRVPRPCLGPPDTAETRRRCLEYALPGKSRCESCEAEAMKKRAVSPGTTPAWRRARKAALDRDGWRCVRCGKIQAQAKAESRTGRGLEVHHLHGEGSSRSAQHDLDKLVTLCPPCHRKVRAKKTRLSLEEWKAQAVERGRARRGR